MDLGSSLRKKVPNPNRRSAHYTKQSPFEGSDRKIRGALLKILISNQYFKEDEIIGYIAEDPDRVNRILCALESEGFIERRNGGFVLR